MTPTTMRSLEVATLAAILLRQSRARKAGDSPSSTARANPYGLPDGRPIARVMAKHFRLMESWAKSWLSRQSEASPPTTVPAMDRFIGPLAADLARLTLPYRRESGRAMRAGLGHPKPKWEPSAGANEARARLAAESIVSTTRDQLQTALDGAAAGGKALAVPPPSSAMPARLGGVAPAPPASRGILGRIADGFRNVFRRAADDRSGVIGETEAIEAIMAGGIEAIDEVAGDLPTKPMKVWGVDANPCPTCVGNAAAGPVALGESFPGGASWPPQHVGCRCGLSISDVPISPPPPPRREVVPTAEDVRAKFPGRTITPEQFEEYTRHSLVRVETYHHTHGAVAPKILRDGIRMEALGGVYGQGFYVSTRHERAYGRSSLTVAYDVRNPFTGTMDEINAKAKELTAGMGEFAAGNAVLVREAFLKAGYDGVILDWGRQYPDDPDQAGRQWLVIMVPENSRFVVGRPGDEGGVQRHDRGKRD